MIDPVSICLLSVAFLSALIAFFRIRSCVSVLKSTILFWFLSTIAWCVHVSMSGDYAMWFVDMNGMETAMNSSAGVFVAFGGMVLQGLFYAMQAKTMLAIAEEFCDDENSNAFIYVPISALAAGIMFILIPEGIITTKWLFAPALVATISVIVGMWDNWDGIESFYKLLLIFLTTGLFLAFVSTFPLLMESGAFIFAGIFFLMSFKDYDIAGQFSSLSYSSGNGDYSSVATDSKKRYYSTASSQISKNMAKVTIKGVYQLNGPKPFTRVIECSSSETGYYTQLMGNKSKQAAWISYNFPGADTNRGFSMSINIK